MSSSYSSQFKQEAVKLAVESDQPVAQTARNLGINPNWAGTQYLCSL